MKELSELNIFNLENYLPHYWFNKGFKDSIVNRALLTLHGGDGGSLITVPSI